MSFLGENEVKIRQLARSPAFEALEEQIREVRSQIYEVYSGELSGKQPEIFKRPLAMKRVVLEWLADHPWGGTARELFDDRDSLQEYAEMKLSRRVEAYSMLLGRLDRRYVRRVKLGKEFRYYVTRDGLGHLQNIIIREKIEELSREVPLFASLRTKITILQMEQMQLFIDKCPEILNVKNVFGIYSYWGKILIEAAEAIRALQASASRPEDRAARESAVYKSEEACNKLQLGSTLMGLAVGLECVSGQYEKNPDGGS